MEQRILYHFAAAALSDAFALALESYTTVMAVLDTAILFEACRGKDEKDARVEPAHDEVEGKGPF